MFNVKRPVQKPIVVIRAATGYELSKYEKNKLANIEPNAQENKIEVISINGERQQIDPEKKEVNIELGSHALRDSILPSDLSMNELFFIKCELAEANLPKEDL
jgi:Tfp pilus assembly protein PilP